MTPADINTNRDAAMTHNHFIKECVECGIVIEQCRCPSKDKEHKYDMCTKCKELQKVKDESRYQ